jgi:hypothetical protein
VTNCDQWWRVIASTRQGLLDEQNESSKPTKPNYYYNASPQDVHVSGVIFHSNLQKNLSFCGRSFLWVVHGGRRDFIRSEWQRSLIAFSFVLHLICILMRAQVPDNKERKKG